MGSTRGAPLANAQHENQTTPLGRRQARKTPRPNAGQDGSTHLTTTNKTTAFTTTTHKIGGPHREKPGTDTDAPLPDDLMILRHIRPTRKAQEINDDDNDSDEGKAQNKKRRTAPTNAITNIDVDKLRATHKTEQRLRHKRKTQHERRQQSIAAKLQHEQRQQSKTAGQPEAPTRPHPKRTNLNERQTTHLHISNERKSTKNKKQQDPRQSKRSKATASTANTTAPPFAPTALNPIREEPEPIHDDHDEKHDYEDPPNTDDHDEKHDYEDPPNTDDHDKKQDEDPPNEDNPEPNQDHEQEATKHISYTEGDDIKALQHAKRLQAGYDYKKRDHERLIKSSPYHQGLRDDIREGNNREYKDNMTGRQAMDRMVKATSIPKESSETCMEIAETIAKADEGTADKQTLKAVHILLHGVAANTDLLSRAMKVCLQLLMNTKAKKIARRARYGIQALMDRHGAAAFAAYTIIIEPLKAAAANAAKGHADDHSNAITTWDAQAAAKLQQLPFTAHQWLSNMTDHVTTKTDDPHNETDLINGNAHWRLGSGPYRRGNTNRIVSHNANSFMKRYRKGELAALLGDKDIDTYHITELRHEMKLTDLETWELRQGLEALGYRHAIWNWCTTTPGIHGSAVISKKRIKAVSFGLTDGIADPEGRTITTDHGNYSNIWTYTPCSKMNEPGIDPRRNDYDTGFNKHYGREKKRTGKPIFIAGDMNVAPHPEDTTIPARDYAIIPSNKPFEKENYYKLLVDHKLANVAEEYAHIDNTNLARTWSKGTPNSHIYMAMRLDHVLAPKDRIGETDGGGYNYPCITDFRTTLHKYGSDHNANCFTITSEPGRDDAIRAPAAYCKPNGLARRYNVCRECNADFGSSNKLHTHIKAYGHERGNQTPMYTPAEACSACTRTNHDKHMDQNYHVNRSDVVGCTYVMCDNHGLPALVRGCEAKCTHKPSSGAPRTCKDKDCITEGAHWLAYHELEHSKAKMWTPPKSDNGTWSRQTRYRGEPATTTTKDKDEAEPTIKDPGKDEPTTATTAALKPKETILTDEQLQELLAASMSKIRRANRDIRQRSKARDNEINEFEKPETYFKLPEISEEDSIYALLTETAQELAQKMNKEDESRQQDDDPRTLAPAMLAATTNRGPEYTPFRGKSLPHERTKIVPETILPMGRKGMPIRSLWDTGACYNIMSYSTALRLGCIINTHCHKPLLELADKTTTRPLGSTSVDVTFGEGLVMAVQFYIFIEAPYDTIFGTDFLDHSSAVIDVGLKTIKLEPNRFNPKKPQLTALIHYNQTHAPTHQEKSAMHSLSTINVPPNSEMTLPIAFFEDRGTKAERWGFVTDAGENQVRVATGLTCALQRTNDKVHYHCKVINPTEIAITIDHTRTLAYFTPVDPNDYTIKDTEDWNDDGTDPGSDLSSEHSDLDGSLDLDRHLTGLTHEELTGLPRAEPRQPACNATAKTNETTYVTKEAEEPQTSEQLEEEWASRPHLHALDLKEAKKSLSKEQLMRLQRTLLRHHDLFDQRPKEPPAHADRCTIQLDPTKTDVWSARTRQMNPQARQILREMVEGQLKKEIIEPSTSPYASPVILVPKKGGGIRFAIDYRSLNACISADSYTLPRVDESLASLNGNVHFSCLDMKEAFWSVPLDEKSREYTAFQTPDGLFQYRRMPMGLKTASAVFCRYVDKMLGNMKWTEVMAYVDDLLIFGKTVDDHLFSLEKLLPRLQKYNMTLGAKKCTFFAPSVQFLGHVVDKEGIRPDPSKVKAITELKLPQTAKDMASSLGLLQYYRRFIKNYTNVEKPIRTKKDTPSAWKKLNGKAQYSDAELQSWKLLTEALTHDPILGHPDWDQPFELHTDACKIGLGATLCQKIDGKERVISFASRSTTQAEKKYHTWELECLAIVWATRLFRMYLQCKNFTVVTDCNAAKHIMSNPAPDASGRIMRWSLAIQDFGFTLIHRKGLKHGDADGLSRQPLFSTERRRCYDHRPRYDAPGRRLTGTLRGASSGDVPVRALRHQRRSCPQRNGL